MKTQDLTGILLDGWIAKAMGYTLEAYLFGYRLRDKEGDVVGFVGPLGVTTLWNYSPSTNWAQGGPILENNAISVEQELKRWVAKKCNAGQTFIVCYGFGKSYLEAAMRCFIVSKFGEELPDLI